MKSAIIIMSVVFVLLSFVMYSEYKRHIAINEGILETVSSLNSDVDVLEAAQLESQEREKELLRKVAYYAAIDSASIGLSYVEMTELIELIPKGNPFFSKWSVTSRYGSDQGYGGDPRTSHLGMDLVAVGSDLRIRAYAPGVSSWLEWGRVEGLNFIIEHGDRVRSRAWHLGKAYYEAQEGNAVDTEIVLGLMGSTGYSDAPHLHFQLEVFARDRWWPIDPYPFLEGERIK